MANINGAYLHGTEVSPNAGLHYLPLRNKGGIAEKILADAIESPINFDTNLAKNHDLCLDVLERDIEEQAILTIARRQPAMDFARSSPRSGFQPILSGFTSHYLECCQWPEKKTRQRATGIHRRGASRVG
jgi:hypothetical protein